MKRKVLVTGGAGFIGRALTKKLIECECDVTIVDDLSTGSAKLLDEKLRGTLIIDDCASEKMLAKVSYGLFDVIFHLAALPRVGFSIDNLAVSTEANVMKTVRLIEALKRSDTRFVFASSSSVNGCVDERDLPIGTDRSKKLQASPYAAQKAFCEDAIKLGASLHGIDAVSVRLFNVYGPGQLPGAVYSTVIPRWFEAALSRAPLLLEGDGEQSRDFTYIDDAVAGMIAIGFSRKVMFGDVYNVASGRAAKINDVLSWFTSKFSDIEVARTSPRRGDVRHTLADISATISDVAYEPTTMIEMGLEKTLEWWKNRK